MDPIRPTRVKNGFSSTNVHSAIFLTMNDIMRMAVQFSSIFSNPKSRKAKPYKQPIPTKFFYRLALREYLFYSLFSLLLLFVTNKKRQRE
jgi:hypothetical protein